MKDLYITITGMKHYYGMAPFEIGKKLKCKKEKHNPYDNEAIKVVMKNVGTIGYVANSPYTKATGTYSAGAIQSLVKKKFKVKVMFITSTKVICKVVDGLKENENQEICTQTDVCEWVVDMDLVIRLFKKSKFGFC